MQPSGACRGSQGSMKSNLCLVARAAARCRQWVLPCCRPPVPTFCALSWPPPANFPPCLRLNFYCEYLLLPFLAWGV